MLKVDPFMPLFTIPVVGPSSFALKKPIDRTSLDKEINGKVTKASDKVGQHIRTHSCSGTIITNYLQDTPLDIVKDVVKHKDIISTALYKRSKVDKEQIKLLLKNLDKNMFKQNT